MTGGLLQLAKRGTQDTHLTGNPQITFFKTIHKRYSNFSMESIQQHFNGTIDFGRKLNCTIAKNGDLIVRFNIIFPDTLSKERKHYLGKILPVEDEVKFSDKAISKVLENVGERIDMEEVNFEEQRDEDNGGVECVQQ